MNLETMAVQGGYTPKNSEPRILPIYQSTTYKYDSSEELAKLFDLQAAGHMYSRISNPTVSALEEKISLMEGGVGALAMSSGQAATSTTLLNICNSGDHVLASAALYGGSFALLSNTFKKFGIEVTFFNQNDSIEDIKALFRPNTKAILAETISNPDLNVLDFNKISNISNEMKVPFIVDNTFATPYLVNPIKHGAHIVIHSTTKYIDGHASCVGGMIVDSGKFDWTEDKYPELVLPDESYHGLSYKEAFKESAFIVKARTHLLRDLGNCMSPFNAFLTNFGCETLHLRMQRHSENALKLATYLENNEHVAWVKYPLLASHPDYSLAKKYLTKGASGVLTFGLKGGKEVSMKFIDNVELTNLVVHVGDIRTCVLHPASTTHRQLSDEDLIKSGVKPDLIRASIGIENIDDIINDFEMAINKAIL